MVWLELYCPNFKLLKSFTCECTMPTFQAPLIYHVCNNDMLIYKCPVGKPDCFTNGHWKQTDTDVCLYYMALVLGTVLWPDLMIPFSQIQRSVKHGWFICVKLITSFIEVKVKSIFDHYPLKS